MLLEIFLILQLSMLTFFVVAFYFKHPLFWAITLIKSVILMYGSMMLQTRDLVFDTTINQVITQYTVHTIPFLLYLNLMFFLLALVFGILDWYDNYNNSSTYIKIGGNK